MKAAAVINHITRACSSGTHLGVATLGPFVAIVTITLSSWSTLNLFIWLVLFPPKNIRVWVVSHFIALGRRLGRLTGRCRFGTFAAGFLVARSLLGCLLLLFFLLEACRVTRWWISTGFRVVCFCLLDPRFTWSFFRIRILFHSKICEWRSSGWGWGRWSQILAWDRF